MDCPFKTTSEALETLEAEESRHFLNQEGTCMYPLIQLHQRFEDLEKLDQVKYNSTTLPFSGAAYRPGVFLLRQWFSEELINSISNEKTACKNYFTNLNRLEDKDKNVNFNWRFL